jgi:TadE-like protein
MSLIRRTTSQQKRRRHRPARKGAVASIELILALPIMLIILMGLIQFSLLMLGLEQVSLAARVGGLEAARTANLTSFVDVPPGVMEIVEKQLDSAGIEWTQVQLEYNIGGQTGVLLAPGTTMDCGPSDTDGPPPPRDWVRVTVCVPLLEIMPNSLVVAGFDLNNNRVAKTSVLYRYDEDPPAPAP